MLTPAIIFTFAYVTGIMTGKFAIIPIQILVYSTILLLFGTIFLLKLRQKPLYLIIFLIYIFGIFAYQNSMALPNNDILHFAQDKYVQVTGSVADEPSNSGEYVKFTLKAEDIRIRGQNYQVCGNVCVYIKDKEISVDYGNKVSVSGKLSKISSTSNSGIASFEDIMSKKRIYCQIFAPNSGLKILSKSIGNPIKYISIIIKNKLLSVIQNTMQEPYSSLLGSIVFGSQASPLSSELQENYRTAGVIHLLVVSGTQVSIILSVFLALCKFLGLAQSARLIVVSFASLMFTIMVGAGPSIIRAAVMSEAALLADSIERANNFYNSMAISVLALLIMDPLNLYDIGFQLSFMATWALFHIAPVIGEKLSAYALPLIARAASVAIAPTIATTPIILYNFGQVSFVSVLSNFMIIPWVEITVVLGFISTIAGLISLPMSWLINNTLTLILALLNAIVNFFASLPFACRYFAPPGLLAIIIYYIIIVAMVEKIKQKAKIRLNLIILFAVLIIGSFGFSHAASDLTITFIDVGQGDSILVESPSGQKMLIDGGGKQENRESKIENREDTVGRSIVVPFLRKKGINELNLIVLTHPHDDHVAGLPYVLEKIKVDMVLDSGQPHTSRAYYRFLKLIENKKIPYKIARAGQVIDLGAGVKGEILHPSEPLITGTESDLNNNSVVIKLTYGSTSFLLMGDTAFEGEERLLSFGYNLKSDVLKVGHHGSRTSTSDEFLKYVRPKYAVISVGAKNKFGHPARETLDRLAKYGIKVLRTDLSGAIVFPSKLCYK
jgi:competence protein ComEC